jgi:hypothetical protein
MVGRSKVASGGMTKITSRLRYSVCREIEREKIRDKVKHMVLVLVVVIMMMMMMMMMIVSYQHDACGTKKKSKKTQNKKRQRWHRDGKGGEEKVEGALANTNKGVPTNRLLNVLVERGPEGFRARVPVVDHHNRQAPK